MDVGRFRSGDQEGVFLNTCSLGVYPELVRERERWSDRIGGWPAGVLAALRVLRADRHPLEAQLRGGTAPLWLLFVGNGTYHRLGLVPARRLDLADGRLDVRVVHGGRRPALRLLAAAVGGPADPLPRPRGASWSTDSIWTRCRRAPSSRTTAKSPRCRAR